ncbi:glycosyltransferase [Polaribacter uvawellassae]|uniref:glycosyltransferase n=1 Tax=Polaribacter uvawellassae TaxID=3133495 RepID=UPI003218EDCE
MNNENYVLVSVHIICYNQEPYLRSCIESILNQVCNFKYEILIADDFSTDGTIKIIDEYSYKNKNIIKPFYSKENNGALKNHLRLFSESKGKYIALCEGDDYWTDPSKLQMQVDFLEANEDFHICHSDVIFIDENNTQIEKKFKRWRYKHDVLDYRAAIFEVITFTCTTMFRNDINLNISSRQQVEGASHLWLLLALKGKVKFLKEKTAAYRVGVGVSKDAIWHKIFYKKAYFIFRKISLKNSFKMNIWLFRGSIYYLLVKLSFDLNIYKLRQIARKFRYNKIYVD